MTKQATMALGDGDIGGGEDGEGGGVLLVALDGGADRFHRLVLE